jgi:hypothetical protein
MTLLAGVCQELIAKTSLQLWMLELEDGDKVDAVAGLPRATKNIHSGTLPVAGGSASSRREVRGIHLGGHVDGRAASVGRRMLPPFLQC